jgi:hypothetical protein
MPKTFKRGDHVEWNSEAGRVRGVIVKKVISKLLFKGYMHHASRDEPQCIIESDTTDHAAIHKRWQSTKGGNSQKVAIHKGRQSTKVEH